MNFRTFSFALTLIAILSTFAACVKTEDLVTAPVETSPSIPSGDRIRIHFGTATQNGCVYSFTNCIWIGWGTEATNFDARMALQFDKSAEASQYFGQYFPLTSDYAVDDAEAHALGIEPQVIPAGFYPFRTISDGTTTGKTIVAFDPAQGYSTGNLVNPNNPQDNIGQLHNLAVQVILNDNRDAIKSLNGDKAAIRQLITEKTIKFLAEAEVPMNTADAQRASTVNLDRDYSNYADRLAESRLSDNDKKVLLAVFDEAAAIPVGSPAELGNFVQLMTEQENRLVANTQLDNRTMVLSMVSVLKYSRYFWYWKSISSPEPGASGTSAKEIPDWVWADIIGMEVGGPGVSVLASAIVYLDTH